MTHKEAVVALLNHMPDELVREIQHYAEYLYVRSRHEQWSDTSLTLLAARYSTDEVEYTTDDLQR